MCTRLSVLLLGLALPLNVLIAAAIWQLSSDASETQRASLQFTSRAVAMAIDAQLGKYIGLAQSIANSFSFLTDDLAAFEREARRELANFSDAEIGGGQLPSKQPPGLASGSRQIAAGFVDRESVEVAAVTLKDVDLGEAHQAAVLLAQVLRANPTRKSRMSAPTVAATILPPVDVV